MYGFLLFLFVVVCFALTLVILLQSSKGGGLAGAFGGMGDMGAVFGGRGAASFLSKVTTVLAAVFLLLSIVLSLMNRGNAGPARSLVEQEQKKRASVPAARLPIVPSDDSRLLPVPPSAAPPATADSAK
ncbi:MAG: preprotein translocase subunit SecG [Calditrichaeota bacterium]|nr:MAG: preprotein translocase subunit SecG [Calditrichota bacterium]